MSDIQAQIQEVVALARTTALQEAEMVVLKRMNKLGTYQLAEARTLRLAAEDIQKLRA